MRQRATIRVAQHEAGAALLRGRLEHPQRELWVALVPVEEVLGVVEDAESVPGEELDRVGDHGDALVQRGPQGLGDVVVPRLADDAHGRGVGLDQLLQREVFVDLALHAARRPERHHRRGLEIELGLRPLEELVVLRVGTGIATLDVVHAEVVELLGDAQLVVDGERQALELAAVPQGRVEDLY